MDRWEPNFKRASGVLSAKYMAAGLLKRMGSGRMVCWVEVLIWQKNLELRSLQGREVAKNLSVEATITLSDLRFGMYGN